MAEKASLKFTKICKYIVNAGMPNEAVYDDISQPIWVDDGENYTDYYIAKWQNKSGIIDHDGTIKFPFIYDKIESIVKDAGRNAYYVISKQNGEVCTTWISLLSNSDKKAGAYHDIEAIYNRSGKLFFVESRSNGMYRLLRPEYSSRNVIVERELDGEVLGKIDLERMYNLISLSVGEYSGCPRETHVIVDENGKCVYAAESEVPYSSITRYSSSENVFVISHREPYVPQDERSGIPYAKEFLILLPSEAPKPSVFLEKMPKGLLFCSDKWPDFLKEKGFYESIVW